MAEWEVTVCAAECGIARVNLPDLIEVIGLERIVIQSAAMCSLTLPPAGMTPHDVIALSCNWSKCPRIKGANLSDLEITDRISSVISRKLGRLRH